MIVIRFTLAFLATLFFASSFAQVRDHTRNTNSWLMYFGNHKISESWGFHAELQWRRHDYFSDNQQLLIRTGVDYYTPNNNRLTLGYAFIRTYPYGEFAVLKAFPEHRIWQQFLTTQALGKFKLSHRYRLEQRLIGNAATGEFSDGRYENRMRYMARLTRNIFGENRPVYIAVYDEVMINFGKEVMYNIFDQNRLYGAVGFTLSDHLKFEAGYLYQLVHLRSLSGSMDVRMEDNHTLQFGLFSTLPLYQKE